MSDDPITAEQKQQLAEAGFVLLENALPPELLESWRRRADAFERAAVAAFRSGSYARGACVVEDPVGPRLTRQDDLHETDGDAALDTLACPAMVAVARDLCGRGAVPLQMDLLYKQQHPHPVILWHQGARHPRGYPYLNIGIYLDDADAGDGCVRYVPGTQHREQDLVGLASRDGWQIPGTVEQPARAGDILVQDMMVLHGSPPKRTPGPRRTIYIEVRPLAGIAESGAQSARWAELRARWMALVLRRADPSAWPHAWRADLPADLGPDADELAEIADYHEPPIPAHYADCPVETEDYPVPADLRG